MAKGLKGSVIQEIDDDEVDYELENPNSFFGSHVNLIPMQSAIQAPRLFYGARFYNQALPLATREAPLVQSLMHGRDEDGHTFDDELGKFMGALRADEDGEVLDVAKNKIVYKDPAGKKKEISLYHNFPFNRKSAATQFTTLKKGDPIKSGQLLATSNFTDKDGKLALGLNARVAVVPYKGWSMDDALAVSESFAKRMVSEQSYTKVQDFDDNTKGGLNHFVSLFPQTFKKDQLSKLDEDGVIKVGSKVKSGDPFVLATVPKVITSADANVGKLSRTLQQSRKNASQIWDYEDEGEVVDVVKGRKGVKVVISSLSPLKKGDKVVLRSGQKNIVSKIIPDDQMLRTVDGKPLDVLLNPTSIPSRVNNGLIYELLLGKVASKTGQPIKVPGFNKSNERWYDFVKSKLDEAGEGETEEVFDPLTNKKLERPITVGIGHMLKLHHVAESKTSARGVGSYDINQQPAKGGGAGAQAKRLSGLESNALLSAGAYHTLREGATLRGQQNDEYWRQLRSGQKPPTPGAPFVWHKFKALLGGAGYHAKDLKDGRLRLGPMTDKILDSYNPVEIKNGEVVDLRTLEPVAGGLFDPALVGGQRSWGKITLPFEVPNPAFEDSVRTLLGLTKKEFEAVLAGKMELPE